MSKPKYRFVRITLDEDTAAMLDRAMIAFGLEDRAETAKMAVRAWCAALMEDATVHQMCQLAVTQIRENEFAALKKFYADRSSNNPTVINLHELRAALDRQEENG